MRLNHLLIIIISSIGLISSSEEKIIEIPLIQKSGYGPFRSGLIGLSPHSDEDDNPWKSTYLQVSGVPENWTETKIGHIETNMYQSVYQNYNLGNITQELYEELQQSWDWKPDTLELSKKPVKTKIAFVYGKDSTEQLRIIVDANNNLDFSDDESFVPFERASGDKRSLDSISLNHSITVTYERLLDNEIVLETTQLFVSYMSQLNRLMANFPQYSIAEFNGETIAICSDRFANLSYENPTIAVINDSLKVGDKLASENLISENEFIEIKGVLYKNLGVKKNKNTLMLEKITTPINELSSTQVGFKPMSIEGYEFMTESHIALDNLKGKYVYLDFWAVWCSPCLQEIPNLKELYKKTNRAKFEIVGIVGESSEDALRKVIINDSITWPQILSTEVNKIKDDYGVTGYPTTFLLDPDGFIIAKGLRGKELEDRVLDMLKE
jgi:thiol-disulfide isomerase/thioredoxin